MEGSEENVIIQQIRICGGSGILHSPVLNAFPQYAFIHSSHACYVLRTVLGAGEAAENKHRQQSCLHRPFAILKRDRS